MILIQDVDEDLGSLKVEIGDKVGRCRWRFWTSHSGDCRKGDTMLRISCRYDDHCSKTWRFGQQKMQLEIWGFEAKKAGDMGIQGPPLIVTYYKGLIKSKVSSGKLKIRFSCCLITTLITWKQVTFVNGLYMMCKIQFCC